MSAMNSNHENAFDREAFRSPPAGACCLEKNIGEAERILFISCWSRARFSRPRPRRDEGAGFDSHRRRLCMARIHRSLPNLQVAWHQQRATQPGNVGSRATRRQTGQDDNRFAASCGPVSLLATTRKPSASDAASQKRPLHRQPAFSLGSRRCTRQRLGVGRRNHQRTRRRNDCLGVTAERRRRNRRQRSLPVTAKRSQYRGRCFSQVQSARRKNGRPTRNPSRRRTRGKTQRRSETFKQVMETGMAPAPAVS